MEIKTTIEREALNAIWPFIEEQRGTLVTTRYAAAIGKVAEALGKKIVVEPRGREPLPTMLYVEEVSS